MTTKSRIVDPVQGNSSLVRPKYSEGLLLNDDDLTAAVDYTKNLSRLLFRSLFGCGVICGLRVEPDPKCEKLFIHIAEGIALDCRGDPIYVPSSQTIILDPKCGVDIPDPIWITLCRHDKCCAPRTAVCSCDDVDSPSVCTRIRDGFELRVLPAKPACACGCAGSDPSKDPKKDDPKYTRQIEPAEPPKDQYLDIKPDAATRPQDCWCVNPEDPCYSRHYGGECACECGDSCDCDCIVLARVTGNQDDGWTADHSVRRFIRPVLMRDPVAYAEQQQKTAIKEYTPLEHARMAERAAGQAANKSQKMAKDVARAVASAEKASIEAQAAAAASEIAKAQAATTAKAVADAAKEAGKRK